MEEGLRAGGVKVAGVSSDFMADNSNQPKGVSNSNVNFHTLETKQTELDDFLIPMSSVLEVHARFENTLYGDFLGKKVAFPFMERNILNGWQKYGVKRVMGDKNGFIQSSKLLGDELTSVHVWIKFHGVPVLAFTANGLSGLVDIRADRALKDTMVILVANSVGNGVTMHTIKVEYEWKPLICGTYVGEKSNDGFQTIQRKDVRDPLVSKHRTRDNEKRKPMDDLFDGTMKKVGAPHMNTGIWLGRKAEYSSESGFMSPNHFDFLTKEDENSILRDLQESDDVQKIKIANPRSMFEREKLSGSNFNDWFRSPKMVLRVEKKLSVIEQPISPAPPADSTAQVLAQWNTVYDAHNEELKSLFDKQAGVERFDLIQTFHACKQEEGKSGSLYVLKMRGYMEQLKCLGYVLPQDHSYGKDLPKKATTPQVMVIQGGRIQKANKKLLNAKGKM
ncbi:hypothetical protein Tco_0842849 [Tanacetum coccineum]|uniref:DUF4283 domain-containing protein n=1 Tax=Tanacetum coccineum TaxID=301880 RepID=A0ABQ5B2L5_9ASTR